MNKETLYWKLAWDTFQLQIFDYNSDINIINDWIKQNNYKVKNILELGCGAGHYLKLLKKYGYKCVGLDIDDKILEYAKQRIFQGDNSIKLLRGNVLTNPFPFLRERFDLVLVKHLSFALIDLEKVLDYAKKTLNPKGPKLLVFDFMIATKDKLNKEILSIDNDIKNSLFLVRLNRMELKEELNKYIWKECYIIKNNRNRTIFIKTNTRSLWFIRPKELNNLLKKKNIEVKKELEEETGIDNLKGVTIYGTFN
jgi:SAM-dependent methyltransferase